MQRRTLLGALATTPLLASTQTTTATGKQKPLAGNTNPPDETTTLTPNTTYTTTLELPQVREPATTHIHITITHRNTTHDIGTLRLTATNQNTGRTLHADEHMQTLEPGDTRTYALTDIGKISNSTITLELETGTTGENEYRISRAATSTTR